MNNNEASKDSRMDKLRERTKYRRELRREARSAFVDATALIDKGREPEAAAAYREAADSIEEAHQERYPDEADSQSGNKPGGSKDHHGD